MNRFALMAGASLLFASPLAPQQDMPPPAKDYAAMSDAELGEEINRLNGEMNSCTEILPTIQEGVERFPEMEFLVPKLAEAEVFASSI